MEYTTLITESKTRISVDTFENWDNRDAPDNIWLNIAVPMSSTSVVMTPAQARELAATLIAFAEAA
jgi:hypothetical protein